MLNTNNQQLGSFGDFKGREAMERERERDRERERQREKDGQWEKHSGLSFGNLTLCFTKSSFVYGQIMERNIPCSIADGSGDMENSGC